MNNSEPEKRTASYKSYIYYTGLGFQMIGVIGLFTFIGYLIDSKRGSEAGLATALFALMGVIVSLIYTIRSIMREKKYD